MAFHHEEALVCIGCYTSFDNLAHRPQGTPSNHSIHALRFDPKSGPLSPLSVIDGVCNPAFLRYHPDGRLLYALTESIYETGQVHAFAVDAAAGRLAPIAYQSAHGKSTCYLSFDPNVQRVLMVNYWDSSLAVCPLSEEGLVEPACAVLPPPAHVHCKCLADHLANRQSEPHMHAIVIAPTVGSSSSQSKTLAFVPDLGTDLIRFFSYDRHTGQLVAAGSVPCASEDEASLTSLTRVTHPFPHVSHVPFSHVSHSHFSYTSHRHFCWTSQHGRPHGPRYIEFDARANAAYVVNELSSTVSVFSYDPAAAQALAADPQMTQATPVLTLVQQISTRETRRDDVRDGVPLLPTAALRKNTCGRICCDPSGTHVLVSNRGDDTIACFKIVRKSTRSERPPSAAPSAAQPPTLKLVGITPTEGRTPRHFQFAGSRNVIVANQDSDSVCVFRFDPNSGTLEFTGCKYQVNSPSFVAARCVSERAPLQEKIVPSNSLEF